MAMASSLPFLSLSLTPKTLIRSALLNEKPICFSSPSPPLPTHSHRTSHSKKLSFSSTRKPGLFGCSAVAEIGHETPAGKNEDDVLVGPSILEEEQVVEYDWREEWYPLYLTKQVPDDAPLGLTVYDKQLVLFRDGNGVIRCYQNRCPHRFQYQEGFEYNDSIRSGVTKVIERLAPNATFAIEATRDSPIPRKDWALRGSHGTDSDRDYESRLAKLSEGQLIDGRLECLYHGWQFEDDGKCVKIPQLPTGAKIPRMACVKTYEVRDSQGVVWVWLGEKKPANIEKLPWFEHYSRPGFQDLSTIHELPYDHSILLENLMDPAHIPISHDRTDWSAKREDAQSLGFKVTERTSRGFAGYWGKAKDMPLPNFLRFQAPCIIENNREFVDKNGKKQYFSALFFCRPAGQGKSMVIVRFGGTIRSPLANILPNWYFHQNAGKVFEQDMGFLSSQNEVLMKEKVPTKDLYLNLKSSDTWVVEYRKWVDKVGHGMPYYIGHSSLSLPKEPAIVEQAPAGLVAGISASSPAKGGVGALHISNPTNRYFRHVVHCKGCRFVLQSFEAWKKAFFVLALASAASAILASGRQWRMLFLASTALFLVGVYGCSSVVTLISTNFIRKHRRL